MSENGRSKNRTRKTIAFPDDLLKAIEKEAKAKYNGDFTRATIEAFARIYPEARKFLRENTTWKHNPKKI